MDTNVTLKMPEFKLVEMIRKMEFGSITIKIQNRNIVLVERITETIKLDN